MIGAAELALLRPTSVLINVSRETISFILLKYQRSLLHALAAPPRDKLTMWTQDPDLPNQAPECLRT